MCFDLGFPQYVQLYQNWSDLNNFLGRCIDCNPTSQQLHHELNQTNKQPNNQTNKKNRSKNCKK